MSHLSSDPFIAVLGANGVGLGQRRWFGSQGFVAERSQAVATALQALRNLLGEQPRRRNELRVLLSADYCRFCLLPWSDAISTPAELQGYARACFEAHYGQSLEGWRICLSPEASGRARVAAAVPEALLQGLEQVSVESRLRLRAVQPYLMGAYNRFAARFGQGDFLFVLAEPQRSLVLLARQGGWQQLRTQSGSDGDASLQALIARECQLQDGQPLAIFVHAPGRVQSRPQLDGVELCELTPPVEPGQDVLSVMARVVA